MTHIKVVPMASVLSDSSDGTYEFTGISTGLHPARAYFMNNGHTVSYRALYMDSDLTNAGRAKSLPSIESTQPEITVERNPDGKGYEWFTDVQDNSWYRNEGSNSEWQRFEA